MRMLPAELAKRYEAEGWWTLDTFGDLLARRLAAAPQTPFLVHSAVRPWAGTFGDVEVVARRLAAGLRDLGVGPGDVVAFQLPNWMEAAAVFWASAFLGAVVVPIVHFYGRKEVGYIARRGDPAGRQRGDLEPGAGSVPGVHRSGTDRAGLARQKWPEELHVLDDFPRTATGKVQKYILRRDIAARQK
jgi:non-ribosomal peptide synthetase component E (peptide arylation enzyme)